MPLGKSDNPLNIYTWTNAQASFNPSNHIKHTPQGPWVIFHIKGPARCCWGFMPAEHLMNSANFLLWAPISSGALPLLRNSFKVHQLFQSALKFTVRLFYMGLLSNLVPLSLSARTTVVRRTKGEEIWAWTLPTLDVKSTEQKRSWGKVPSSGLNRVTIFYPSTLFQPPLPHLAPLLSNSHALFSWLAGLLTLAAVFRALCEWLHCEDRTFRVLCEIKRKFWGSYWWSVNLLTFKILGTAF